MNKKINILMILTGLSLLSNLYCMRKNTYKKRQKRRPFFGIKAPKKQQPQQESSQYSYYPQKEEYSCLPNTSYYNDHNQQQSNRDFRERKSDNTVAQVLQYYKPTYTNDNTSKPQQTETTPMQQNAKQIDLIEKIYQVNFQINNFERKMRALSPKTRSQFDYIPRPNSHPPKKYSQDNYMPTLNSNTQQDMYDFLTNASPEEIVKKLEPMDNKTRCEIIERISCKNKKRKVDDDLLWSDLSKEMDAFAEETRREFAKRERKKSYRHQQTESNWIYDKEETGEETDETSESDEENFQDTNVHHRPISSPYVFRHCDEQGIPLRTSNPAPSGFHASSPFAFRNSPVHPLKNMRNNQNNQTSMHRPFKPVYFPQMLTAFTCFGNHRVNNSLQIDKTDKEDDTVEWVMQEVENQRDRK